MNENIESLETPVPVNPGIEAVKEGVAPSGPVDIQALLGKALSSFDGVDEEEEHDEEEVYYPEEEDNENVISDFSVDGDVDVGNLFDEI